MKIRATVPLAAILLAPCLPLAPKSAHAQKPSPPPASTAAPDYSRESVVFDNITRIYRYAADGTGSRDITGVVEVRNQAAVKDLSVITFPFASASEHVEIDYVRVHHTDGTLVTTPPTDAQELPTQVTREAPFYSDLKEEQIPIRGLQAGDHLEYKLRIVRTKAEAPGHFWGNETFFLPSTGFVILSEVVELHVPRTSFVQTWSPHTKPTVSETPDEQVFRWSSAQRQPVAGKLRNALLLMDNNPTLGTDDTPRLPDVAWTNFHSWAEVGAWYRSVEGSRTDPSDDVRARVATLNAGKSTPDEKARAIYAYVSNQIRYIGVAFGVGRYQPHEAADVLSNQYGDCKDKATLLASMLSAAGIPTDTVLVGAGITFNDAVPSPGSFNHAISLAHIDGKPIWLDSTAEVAPFGLLSFSIRDHKALVVPLTGDAHVETTPRDSPVPEGSNFQAVGTLDEHGTSHSHMVLDLHGDEEVPFRQAVRSVSTAQWDELMQRISQNLSFAGKVTNTQFSRADDTSVPVHITYDYEREKSGDWDTLRILAQMPPAGFPDVDEKDPPVTPIELGIPQVETAHASMTLPKGWTADLPASVHMKSSFATVDTTYKLQNGALITDRRIEILKKNIPASDWKSYQQWIKDAGLVNENYIQLVENSAAIGSTSTLTVNSGNRAAADLIREATQDEQRKDWAAATAKLDAAKAINPHQPFLDSNYGYVAVHTGKVAKGIADYKREITAHPDEDYVFQLLAAAQFPADPTAAIATLQAAVARNPSFEQNVLYLSFILVRRGEYADAEKVLRAGLASKPDELVLKLRLGKVLFHQHKNAEAEPLLKAVIEASKDPGQLNDAAYELANASVDLPLADKTARQALDLLDTATNNGETGPAALRRASLLVSTWDTLGWILYREDKIAEAEPWIRAAWRNGNGAEPGYHLGILLEEQKQPAAALGIYLLADSGQPGIDDIAVHKLLADKIATLRAAGLPDPAKNPALDLQNQRTYEVPHDTLQASGESWATIELYVTPQGTTDFNIVQGDQSLQPLSDAIQHLNLDLQLPPATHAKLVRRGVLSCHSSKLCQLVLIPTGDAPNS